MFARSFYFLRHGETDWNVAGRLQGSMDIPLNANGVQQARDAAARFYGCTIDTCVVSDLNRAVTTARFALRYSDAPMYIDSRIKERNFGAWEGQLSGKMKESVGLKPTQRLTHEYTPPEGESWVDFEARVVAGIHAGLAAHDGNVLFVAHGYVFVALTKLLLGEDTMSKNCVPYLFEKDADGWGLVEV